MLPFELSAIDLILVIAVVVLVVLFVARSSVKTPVEEGAVSRVAKARPRSTVAAVADVEEDSRERFPPQPQRASSQCTYGFGYLRKRPRDAPVPDGCLSCSRMIECSGSRD